MAESAEVIDPRGRAPSGKFVKGHSFKPPGRPPKPKVEEVDYLRLIRLALNEDESLAIIRRAIVDAKGGNRYARQWLFSHVVSARPKMIQVESEHEASQVFRDFVDRLSFDELRTFIQIRRRLDKPSNPIDAPPPEPETTQAMELMAIAFQRLEQEVATKS